jgi:hypothetical protein
LLFPITSTSATGNGLIRRCGINPPDEAGFGICNLHAKGYGKSKAVTLKSFKEKLSSQGAKRNGNEKENSIDIL